MSRRVHEWAWGDVARKTVCGVVRRIDLAEIVTDLGKVDPQRRCLSCARLRAAYGTSSKLAAGGDSAAPGPAEQAGRAADTVAMGLTISESERALMAHTTGWESKWPLYRNHFCASPDGDDWKTIEGLIARGLMYRAREPSDLSGGDTVFAVTPLGVSALKRGSRVGRRPVRTSNGAS
jgi:hypothetical protein